MNFDDDHHTRELDRVTLIMECTQRPVRLAPPEVERLFAGTARDFWRWVVQHETDVPADDQPAPADAHWLRVRQALASMRQIPVEAVTPESRLAL